MIVTRTPFRISFFGGGTDFPEYFKDNGGSVLSTTINKYCYLMCRDLPPFFDYKYRIRYTKREETDSISEIEHPVVREALKYLDYKKGIELVHTSDIPANSGIGSSSAFTVGFLHAVHAMKGKILTKRFLADEAIKIEHDILTENVGSQDQIAAAFGGFNKIDFFDNKKYYVSPISISPKKIKTLTNNIMLFFTGLTRYSSEISEEHKKNISKKGPELKAMKEMVDEAVNILNSPVDSINEFGKLLNESWKIKRSLSVKVTNSTIDEAYGAALSAGALGGKICGAGGGGMLMLFVPTEFQKNVKNVLKKFLHIPITFESMGSQITMYAPGVING